ncbi:MAG: Cell shape determining protein, MreB/Mrl family [Parcubacteria group bacterium GW2011_GWB1_45_7]|nr:MAG: Cell shape determining protein, MreB/Mrl family [Parcubacteria group bacterium GW2011_GWB1_45_7]OGY58624.1 MAG: rod shape-determining protein [Candidatus Colwellbacteria bacterium RIFCSPHIGHO2_02_FULL_45_17]
MIKLLENFYRVVGIDLGTANTLIYVKGHGIVVDQPTLVAVNNRTEQILAIGEEAKKMLDRVPAHVTLIKPLMNGVISDFEMTEEILRHFLKKASGKNVMSRYHLAAITIPTNLTEVERKSVEDAVVSAGASKVLLVEEPIASAIGMRLPVEEATASLIINIGGGSTEISIISVGGAVKSRSIKIAGQQFNDDIAKFMKNEYKILVGEPTAEAIKTSIGSAIPLEERKEIAVRGRDFGSGLPKEVSVRNNHIRGALQKSLKGISEAIKELLEESPPELVGDVYQRGIFLAGGGALLRGMDQFLTKELSVKTTLVDDPLTCAVRGLGIIIEDLPKYETILSNQNRPLPINL